MPRFYDSRTWNILNEVPPSMFSLVRGALSLRQKVVIATQSLKFLKRCRTTNLLPNFITNKKIGEVCNLPEDHPRIRNIYKSILSTVIKQKQHVLYSSLLKCVAKEEACRRYLDEQVWKRIEGASRRICDSIRSRAKSVLCAKFDRLLSSPRVNHQDVASSSQVNHQPKNISTQNAITSSRTARITVLGGAQISDNAKSFLSLGPSFAPTQIINAQVIRKVVGGLHRLRDQLRVKCKRANQPQISSTLSRRPLPPIPFPRSFYKEPEPCADADIKFRILSSGVLSILTKNKRQRQSNLTYEQWQGFKEIRQLTECGMIRLSVSDKGGEFVVMPQTLDREITELHLTDATVYQCSTRNEFISQYKRLNHIWMTIGKAAGLSENFLSRLKIDNPNCPVFYSLIKTHKLSITDMEPLPITEYKIRPIVSCVGGPTDRISWFLNKIVSQLLLKFAISLIGTMGTVTESSPIMAFLTLVILVIALSSLYRLVYVAYAFYTIEENVETLKAKGYLNAEVRKEDMDGNTYVIVALPHALMVFVALAISGLTCALFDYYKD